MMKKFIALYYNTSGAHHPQPEMTDAQRAAALAPWGEWQAKHGAGVADMGAPCKPAIASSNGESWEPSRNFVTGYSIVSAVDLEAAKKIFSGHPIYNYPDHAIEISECAAL